MQRSLAEENNRLKRELDEAHKQISEKDRLIYALCFTVVRAQKEIWRAQLSENAAQVDVMHLQEQVALQQPASAVGLPPGAMTAMTQARQSWMPGQGPLVYPVQQQFPQPPTGYGPP